MRVRRFINLFNPSFRSFVCLSASLVLVLGTVPAANANPTSFLTSTRDFDARSLTRSGSLPFSAPSTPSASSLSFAEPGRFSMHQSYALTAATGPAGSTSAGIYLNTLMYRLSAPLTVFADVGFYSQLHSTTVPGTQQEGGPGSLVLPRMGLEYKPTERLTMNLELVNGPDAAKAYGGMPWSSHVSPGSFGP